MSSRTTEQISFLRRKMELILSRDRFEITVSDCKHHVDIYDKHDFFDAVKLTMKLNSVDWPTNADIRWRAQASGNKHR